MAKLENKTKENPKLEQNKLSDGRISLYLEYYLGREEKPVLDENGNQVYYDSGKMQGKPKFAVKHNRRKENLSLYLIDKPRTPAERQQNKETLELATKQVGVDRFFAEVLPEDKANFVQQAKAEGHTVVMIGDGINDSPALSAADIGIAINSGAAIAREIADVTIKADSLEELVALKAIANSLQKRVRANYRFVLTFNSALIALGALGILQPASSAMLHNLSTIGISLKSMTNLLPENKAPQLKA